MRMCENEREREREREKERERERFSKFSTLVEQITYRHSQKGFKG